LEFLSHLDFQQLFIKSLEIIKNGSDLNSMSEKIIWICYLNKFGALSSNTGCKKAFLILARSLKSS